MTKVTLLGDSIRMGYGKLVPGMLGEGYTVFQPEENCRFSKYTLRGLFDWREGIAGSDIIHWNNGLWDMTSCVDGKPFCDVDEYIRNMVRIAGILKERAKVVIFATTTPVCSENNYYDNNEYIIKYNEAIVPVLRDMGIIINDLHSVVYPNIPEYVCEDKIHLSEVGYKVVSEKVVEAIKNAEVLIK